MQETLDKQTNLVRAIRTLGPDRVLVSKKDLPVRYSEQTLFLANIANKTEGTDFRLVFLQGLSLLEQQANLRITADWWKRPGETIANVRSPHGAGYYLLNFVGQFPQTEWRRQQEQIGEGNMMERACEAVVAEAVMALHTTCKISLMTSWTHWGETQVARDKISTVGPLDREKITIDAEHHMNDSRDDLRVVLFRKFDF